jgi:hypothetical protein
LAPNKGPNAVELLLQALGFCYAVGYVANAAARAIEVTRMDYDVEGDVARTRHSPCSLLWRLSKRSRLGGSPASDHLPAGGQCQHPGCEPYPKAIQAAKEHKPWCMSMARSGCGPAPADSARASMTNRSNRAFIDSR